MNGSTSITPAAAAASSRFVDNGDGTITDTASGLMWSQATLSKKCVTHAQAETICSGLDLAGHTDWRLPSVEELFLLADRSRSLPATDTTAFPDTKSDWYWTSTPHASDSSDAWFVSFSDGSAYYCLRDGHGAFVRAVRSAPAGQ